MFYNNRITALYICTSFFITICATKNETFIERNQKMNDNNQHKTASLWITKYKKTIPSQGIFSIQDNHGTSLVLEWETIQGKSPRLASKVKELHDILAEIYTPQEIEFAKKFPDLVPQEYFLKILAPLFQGENEVNWQDAELQLKTFFDKFFTTTDFTQFSGKDDLSIFVVAKKPKTERILGIIQFMITSDYQEGEVKVAYFGVTSKSKNSGLEKLLMSSIFKLIPRTQRIFMHTRCTNERAIKLYKSWGFTQFPGPLPHWIDLEYVTKNIDTLQKTANTITL